MTTQLLKNQKGAALAITLMVFVVTVLFSSIFIARTIAEKRSVDRQRDLLRAFYIAEGGSEQGLDHIDLLINTHLFATVSSTDSTYLSSQASGYVSSNDSLGFLLEFGKDNGTALFSLVESNTKLQNNAAAVNVGDMSYDHRLVISPKKDPLEIPPDKWNFYYDFVIESTGISGENQEQVMVSGDFTVFVRKNTYSRYALLTNEQIHQESPLAPAEIVWFGEKTNFSGPIHTNGIFSFIGDPAGTYVGVLSQSNVLARFYNNGSTLLADADSNPGIDEPILYSKYRRGEPVINLPASADNQKFIDEARAGDATAGNGIFVVNDGSSLTGGIYVNGDATIDLTVSSDQAVYTIVQGGVTKNITVDIAGNQTAVETVGVGTTTYDGLPDGISDEGQIIYVEGNITSLAGTLQKDTELMIVGEQAVTITDHLEYSDYIPAVSTPDQGDYEPPNAAGKTNLLGVISWNSNVEIAATAPANINIHGMIMARNGEFTVEGYDAGSPKGYATILGGITSMNYGPFGTFNVGTGSLETGYERNFVYDKRAMLFSPPYSPVIGNYVALTNDLTDKLSWKQGGL